MNNEKFAWTIDTSFDRFKKEFLKRVSSPETYKQIGSVLVFILPTLFLLILGLRRELSISFGRLGFYILILFIAVLILIILLFIRMQAPLWKNKFTNYEVSSKGVKINEQFFKWDKFKSYTTQEEILEDIDEAAGVVTGGLPHLDYTGDVNYIHLLRDRHGLKREALLAFDDENLYQEVLNFVKQKLPEMEG